MGASGNGARRSDAARGLRRGLYLRPVATMPWLPSQVRPLS